MIASSGAAGIATLVLVARGRFGPARVSAVLAVVATLAGWAVAQEPELLPGLTISQAAAGRSTLIAVIVGVAAGAVVLVPSLALLFTLFLRGSLDYGARGRPEPLVPAPGRKAPPHLRPAVTLACLFGGVGLMVFTDAGWTHAIGLLCLFGLAALTFGAAAVAPEHD
jgi:cytochrome bd ubiquinol oxidase subunit II